MREMVDRFPDVMLIDATHGTNASKSKIFSFMVHDALGKGQFVQHAVLRNDRSSTLLTDIKEFKINSPAWTDFHCVVIDKDFTEMAVLEAAFPGVRDILFSST
ncbi:unnamed protein product [Phytophthora fragariaefolia]|uniref:Unnamed protein product n=1 Tax=Phytophthora fragariaefolia TaxID=1490495 RepID=A0A9W7D4Y2_9STRA|nr:unnamed protein product [Phytophthora fragariaefolia]